MKHFIINILKRLTKKILTKNNVQIIVITGNVGKTSARNNLVEFLSQYDTVGTNLDNYNSDIGVILSILKEKSPKKNPFSWLRIILKAWIMSISKQKNFPSIWVLELGIDFPKDMDFFVDNFLKFDVIIFGYVGKNPVHLGNFKNRDELILEKSKILRGLKPDGLLIIDGDDSYLKKYYNNRSNVISYGFSDSVDLKASDFKIKLTIDNNKETIEKFYSKIVPKGSFKISYKGSNIPFHVDYLLAEHQIYALLSTIAFAIHTNINLVDISKQITSIKPLKGRLRIIEGIKDSLLMEDTYNSAPKAMESAIKTLYDIKIPNIRRVAILGSMKELGKDSDKIHKNIGKLLSQNVDLFIAVGEEIKPAFQEFNKLTKSKEKSIWVPNSNSILERITDLITSNDLILIKGSESSRMEKISAKLLLNQKFSKELLPRQSKDWLAKN